MAEVYRGTGRRIAQLVGDSTVLDVVAQEIAARAQANATANFRTGRYSQNFRVEKVKARRGTVMDRVVVNDHPAAVAVEYGHWAGDEANPTWVAGQFNLTRAIRGV